MLITAFFEDWSYKVQHLDEISQKLVDVVDVQPFVKWFGLDQYLEQNWNEEEISFFSPIWLKSLSGAISDRVVLDEVYRFDVFSNLIMAIKVPDDHDQLEYYFYDPVADVNVADMKVPSLTQYSDWLVPFYDYIEKEHRFITFSAKSHGNADTYGDDFNLIELNLTNHTETVLFDDLKNKPITCSPDGMHCLYGYQFEQILDLELGEAVF